MPGGGAATPVCITVPGSYTVTLAPWDAGTADPAHPGASIPSLTLGATQGPGKQTLLIDGLSSTSDSNEQVNNTFLSTALPSLIRARGRLVLATTDGGTKPKGVPYGGVASVSGGSFANYGTVTTTVQDLDNKAANVTQFFGALTNERGGTVADRSGLLQVNSVTNKGTLTVAPKASLDLHSQGPVAACPAVCSPTQGLSKTAGPFRPRAGPGPSSAER